MHEVPPWLVSDWQALFARHVNGNLPHALLVDGTQGIGKSRFIQHAVSTLLCNDNASGSPCGTCSSCLLIHSDNHPDIRTLEPVEGESVIRVDAVRGLIDWLQLTPQYDSYKIAVVTPAELMNHNAANSLLKTLEEPATRDLIFLITHSAGSLPATIRSRCQRITLTLRDRQCALDWLQDNKVSEPEIALALAGDGPLLAATLDASDFRGNRQRMLKAWHDILLGNASVARSVESISDLPTAECLRTFASWVSDITRLRINEHLQIRNQDVREPLAELSNCLTTEQWFTLYDQLLTLDRIDSASFKTQAVLEGIFADIRLKQSV